MRACCPPAMAARSSGVRPGEGCEQTANKQASGEKQQQHQTRTADIDRLQSSLVHSNTVHQQVQRWAGQRDSSSKSNNSSGGWACRSAASIRPYTNVQQNQGRPAYVPRIYERAASALPTRSPRTVRIPPRPLARPPTLPPCCCLPAAAWSRTRGSAPAASSSSAMAPCRHGDTRS